MPRLPAPIILGVMLVVAACNRLPAEDAAQDSLARHLLADSRDGVLDEFDLPSACLIAGGVADLRELEALRQQIAARLDTISRSILQRGSVEHRTATVLSQLHAEMLTGTYDKQATDLRRTLADGDFNCLSALVLYLELGQRVGVPLEIWSQPGHVYCVLAGQDLRIEPASGQWQATSPFPQRGTLARRITSVELVGKFYYNRGVELLEAKSFEAGIEALRIACQLDPLDVDSRTNLLAGLNNWAVSLVAQDQQAAAAALIARGLAIDPAFAPLVANERFLRERISGSRP
jgi:hypothetical protein